jgi:hypothetical protein
VSGRTDRGNTEMSTLYVAKKLCCVGGFEAIFYELTFIEVSNFYRFLYVRKSIRSKQNIASNKLLSWKS